MVQRYNFSLGSRKMHDFNRHEIMQENTPHPKNERKMSRGLEKLSSLYLL